MIHSHTLSVQAFLISCDRIKCYTLSLANGNIPMTSTKLKVTLSTLGFYDIITALIAR